MAIASLRHLIFFAAALLTLADTGLGQGAIHWSSYKTVDGLPEAVFNSISFTPQGKLIATAVNVPTICELDGYSVSNLVAPAGAIGRVCASPGGQRWALVSGGLLEFKNNAWLQHPISEIPATPRTNSIQSITETPFLPVRQGCVIFLRPDRLMEFSAEDPARADTTTICTAAQLQIGKLTGMTPSFDGGLWICGERGVARTTTLSRNLTPDASWQEYFPPDGWHLENLSAPEPDDEGGITMVAESAASHQKVAATFDGLQWTIRPAGLEKIFRAWRGPDRTFWAATPESLFEWDDAHTNWMADDEISAGRFFDVETEPGGAFWLATSEGLIRGSASVWQKPEWPGDMDLAVRCIRADMDNRLYFVAGNKLYVQDNESHREFPLPIPSSEPPERCALFPFENATLLVQAGGNLFQFQREEGSFKPFQPQHEPGVVALGYLPAGNLCLYAPGTGFEVFGGKQIYPLSGAPTFKEAGTRFTTLLTARNGDLWIGGEHDVLWRHSDTWQEFVSGENVSPEGAIGFAEFPDGKIWCATPDELWQFDGKNWLLLQTKFNHINSLMQSRDGSIWIASNGGLFRFYKGAWLEGSLEEGFPRGAVFGVCEDERGRIWSATTHGLSVFHPEADSDPPKTFVHRLVGEDNQLSEGSTLNLLLQGRDKWKFVSPAQLLYSYQLDQHDWTPFQDQISLSFSDLSPGRHYFQVRAMDPAGNLESDPATLDFTIALPWFKEVRLWVVLTLGAGAAIFFAAVAWNRHRQLLLSHAAVERKVAERTRELEIATRELLHSQKMTALGTLAAGIAHDFNNILSIIKGSAQIIEDNTGQPEKIRTRVDRIKTVVQQGAEIVDAMLGFSRGSEALPAPCDVNAVVTDTMKLLGDRFLREVEVKFEHAPRLPEIVAPREFIQQVLLNFIFNASEAMNGHKEIHLATNTTNKLPPEIILAPKTAAAFVLVSVRDCGSGIAPEIMPRIFEPFFTTKALSARRGTGLGLSMVYELAKKMDAGLSVQSVVGQGSTFTLILPAPKQRDKKEPSEPSD